MSGIYIGTIILVRRQGENFLCLETHPNIIADYYSLLLHQPPTNRPLHRLGLYGHETPRKLWAPNRKNLRVGILFQIAKTFMVHQWQQHKHTWHQGKHISLKLPLFWVTRKELIWKYAPNTYFVGLSPLSNTIIHAYLWRVVSLGGILRLQER